VVIIVHAQELKLHLRPCRRHVVRHSLGVGPMLQDAPVCVYVCVCVCVCV